MTYQQVGEQDRHEEDDPDDVGNRGKLQLRSGVIQWVGGLAEDGIVLKLSCRHGHGLHQGPGWGGEWGALQGAEEGKVSWL